MMEFNNPGLEGLHVGWVGRNLRVIFLRLDYGSQFFLVEVEETFTEEERVVYSLTMGMCGK